MYGLMMDDQLTLRPMMERAYKLFGRKEIVTRTDWGLHRHTYSDFYERCGRLANGLARLGIKRGDRVGTFAWNSYRHLELYFGV
ncbi:MAG: AMP-binding protein, partial [Anaerolineales bacterium]|nr:AMP-binding protein [Anaerolineales bacterium]